MKLFTIVLAAALLTGCASWKTPGKIDQPVLIQQKLVPITIPDEMLEIPPYPAAVDPYKMTDRDLAEWLIDNEKRNQEIGNRLDAIKKYQERRLKDLLPVLK